MIFKLDNALYLFSTFITKVIETFRCFMKRNQELKKKYVNKKKAFKGVAIDM